MTKHVVGYIEGNPPNGLKVLDKDGKTIGHVISTELIDGMTTIELTPEGVAWYDAIAEEGKQISFSAGFNR